MSIINITRLINRMNAKFTWKAPEWRHWTFSDVFSIINFNHALISSNIYSFIVIKTKSHIWKRLKQSHSRFLYVHLAHNISSHNYICSQVWRHEKIWNLLRFMIERRRRKESHHCHSLQKTRNTEYHWADHMICNYRQYNILLIRSHQMQVYDDVDIPVSICL